MFTYDLRLLVQYRARFGLQALGASGPEDKDGEVIASLVNKGALDIIAKVWVISVALDYTRHCPVDVICGKMCSLSSGPLTEASETSFWSPM